MNNNNNSSKPPRPGKSRPRNRRKRGGSSSSSSSNKPPEVPQLKVTLRHVGNIDKYGSVENMMSLIQNLVGRVNEEITIMIANHGNSSNATIAGAGAAAVLPIRLDVGSMQTLIDEEKMVLERAEREQAKVNDTEGETAEEDGDGTKEGADEAEPGQTMDVDAPDETKTGPVAAADDGIKVGYASAAKKDISDDTLPVGPCVQASVLYTLPPKKSRRRGIKTGCAFLALSAPSVLTNGTAASPPGAFQKEGVPMSNANGSATTKTTVPVPVPLTPAQRARILALGRLQLRNALESLVSIAKQDIKSTNPLFAGCIVEQSLNQKTWNVNKQKFDNRVGTIETTGDYMRFQEEQAKQREERLSRPKPAPGGGGASTTMDNVTDESGQPLAALVLHLRAKRERDARSKKKSTKVRSNMEGRAKRKKGGQGGGEGAKKDGKPKGAKSRPKKKKGGKGKSSDSSRSSTKPAKTMTLLDKAGIK